MSEAVGSLYEAVAGLDPLTRWALPSEASLAAAKTAPGLVPAAPVVWSARLPDRVTALKAGDDGLTALSHDGSLAKIDGDGKLTSSKPLTAAEATRAEKDLAAPVEPDAGKTHSRTDRLFKLSAAHEGRTAVAYWGGTLRVFGDKGGVFTEQQLPQDVTALTWLDGKVVAGLADGRVLALTAPK
jgi:hypothetical protein